MRNPIKYLPFEWRKNNEFTVPVGPSFSHAFRTPMYLEGSKVCITAPVHSPHHRIDKQKDTYPGYDVLLESPAGLRPDLTMPVPRWGVACLLARRWAFYGPWMSGCKGELHVSVAVIGRAREYQLPNISFFNPKAFETVLMHYLNDRYGYENWEGTMAHIPRYHGPVEWSCHSHLPVPSASFKICGRGESLSELYPHEQLFVFPVSDQYFVEVCFIQDFYSRDGKGNLAFDKTPIQELQDKIFSSITLDLSPAAKSRVNKVRAEVGNLRMCKDFAPLKWPTNVYPPEADSSPEARQALRNNA